MADQAIPAVSTSTTTQSATTSKPRCFDPDTLRDTLRAVIAPSNLAEALRRNEEACLAAQKLSEVVQNNPGNPIPLQTSLQWTPLSSSDGEFLDSTRVCSMGVISGPPPFSM